MTSPLEIVRDSCIAANPEIMELKFGCEVKHEPSSYMGIDYRGTYLHEARGKNQNLIFFPGAEEGSQRAYSTTINKKDFKILGRPIRLADILLAIGKTDQHYPIICDVAGTFWGTYRGHGFTQDGKKWIDKDGKWNLLHDDLSQQSPATIKFLAEILK